MPPAVVPGAIAAAVLALSFRFLGNRAASRVLRRRLWAHVLELRLFGDEPALAFGGLLRILKTNVLLLAHALPPVAAAAPLVVLLAFAARDFSARIPLAAGEDAVLTVRLRGASAAPVELQAPPWVAVDSPPVHVPQAGETSWRLRAVAHGSAPCRISAAGESVTKRLDASVRSSAWLDLLRHPVGKPLPHGGAIERIWIAPLPATDWFEWFAVTASLGAWLFHFLLQRL